MPILPGCPVGLGPLALTRSTSFANAGLMEQNRQWDLDLEESAQGTDSYSAPGGAAHLEDAREASDEATAGLGEIRSSPTRRVDTARVRRRELGEAMNQLEFSLTGPMASEGWLDGVREALSDLRESVVEHIGVTEGSGGLLEEIQDAAPRLSNEIGFIEAEHDELLALIEKAEAAARQSTDRKAIRNRAMSILPRLTLHRQRGADLVYEAYNVDIAAGD